MIKHEVRTMPRGMPTYKVGTTVRLSEKQPKGSRLLTRYPGMRGVVIASTLGMSRVEWRPEGTTPGVILHYNTEIIRCNKFTLTPNADVTGLAPRKDEQ